MYQINTNNFEIEMNGSKYRIFSVIKVPAIRITRRGVLK